MILGLDVSTSITGVSVINRKGDVLLCEAIDTRNKNKFSSLLSKASFIKSKLQEIKNTHKIDEIYIEESLQSFRSGFSSAKTLSTLSKINGIVSYLAWEIFEKEPEYIAATSARKLCGVKVPRGQKAKQVVLNFILDNEPDFVIEYTRHGNPCPGTYDRADSLILARAGLEYCRQKN